MSDKLHFSLFALPSTRHYLNIYFDVFMMTLNLYEFFYSCIPKLDICKTFLSLLFRMHYLSQSGTYKSPQNFTTHESLCRYESKMNQVMLFQQHQTCAILKQQQQNPKSFIQSLDAYYFYIDVKLCLITKTTCTVE